MRLTFNILWFEDTPKFTEGIILPVREHLDEQEYYLNIIDVLPNGDRLEELIKKINDKQLEVDLILMDYNLANKEETGDKLIKTIRQRKLLTDIIFYSEDRGFRDKIGPLDGVYLEDRDNLEDKIIEVVDHILRKSMDLSNLRGLVMAETSELDELMFQIVQHFLDGDIFQETITKKNKIKNKYTRSTNDKLKKIEKINIEGVSGTQELLHELEASHMARAIARLINDMKEQSNKNNPKLKTITKNIGEFDANDYRVKISSLRNLLAHVKEEKNEDGQKILKSIRRGEDFIFDEEKALAARKTLKRYFETLTGIYNTINPKKKDN